MEEEGCGERGKEGGGAGERGHSNADNPELEGAAQLDADQVQLRLQAAAARRERVEGLLEGEAGVEGDAEERGALLPVAAGRSR